MTDTLDAAWRTLPSALLQLVHTYVPPGPVQGPQAPHIVIYDYMSASGYRILKSRRVHDDPLTDDDDTILARCSEEDYPRLLEKFHGRGRGLSYHVRCDYCDRWCGLRGWGEWIHDDS